MGIKASLLKRKSKQTRSKGILVGAGGGFLQSLGITLLLVVFIKFMGRANFRNFLPIAVKLGMHDQHQVKMFFMYVFMWLGAVTVHLNINWRLMAV